jgi:putative sterol carrier protein
MGKDESKSTKKGGGTMTTVRYCTPEWLEASATGYEENPKFKQEFAKLNVRLCFRIKAEPAWGIEEAIIFAGYVNKGKLEKLAFVDEEEAKRDAEFLLAATPQEWKKLLRKDTKFVTEFMLGRIVLEQGSRVGILQVAPYSNTFVEALTPVDLQFPDEMSPEELAEYRTYVEQFRQELGV